MNPTAETFTDPTRRGRVAEEAAQLFDPRASMKQKAMAGGIVGALLLTVLGLISTRHQLEKRPLTKTQPTQAPKAIEEPATLVPLTLSAPTPARDEVLGERLARFDRALDRVSRNSRTSADLSSAEADLLTSDVEAALGGSVASKLRDMVSVAKDTAHASPFDLDSVAKLDVAVASLDNNLLAHQLPYFIDVNVLADTRARHGAARRILVFFEYKVLESHLYASTIKRRSEGLLSKGPEIEAFVRTVRVRPLGGSRRHASMGLVNPRKAQATVMLDAIDGEVVKNVLPALADDAPMPLPGRSSSNPRDAAAHAMARYAGARMREELRDLPGVDVEAARDLGNALRERRELFERWSTSLRGLGELSVPDRLDLETTTLEGRDLDDADLEELKNIQARLTSEHATKTYLAIRDAIADSVERHEVQHRLDLKSDNLDEPLPIPECVGALLPDPQAVDLRETVRSELSGYLAQVAREDHVPKTVFTLLLRFLINPRMRASTEGVVAKIVAAELAKEQNLPVRDLTSESGIALAYRDLTSTPPHELRQAASRAWARLFERDLPKLVHASTSAR